MPPKKMKFDLSDIIRHGNFFNFREIVRDAATTTSWEDATIRLIYKKKMEIVKLVIDNYKFLNHNCIISAILNHHKYFRSERFIIALNWLGDAHNDESYINKKTSVIRIGNCVTRGQLLLNAGLNYKAFGIYNRRLDNNFFHWTPEIHKNTGKKFRTQIKTLLLCLKRLEIHIPSVLKILLIRICAVAEIYRMRAVGSVIHAGNGDLKHEFYRINFNPNLRFNRKNYIDQTSFFHLYHYPIRDTLYTEIPKSLLLGFYLREDCLDDLAALYGLKMQIYAHLTEIFEDLPIEDFVYILRNYKHHFDYTDVLSHFVMWKNISHVAIFLQHVKLTERDIKWLENDTMYGKGIPSLHLLISYGINPLRSTRYNYTLEKLGMEYWLHWKDENFWKLTPNVRSQIKSWLLVNNRLQLLPRGLEKKIVEMIPVAEIEGLMKGKNYDQ